jgi:SAM-dependent methyltransferase
MGKAEKANWYELPRYYDIAFRDETPREIGFLQAAFERYSRISVRTVLEPACGSGRLVRELAAAGFRVIGFDLSRPALAYCARRLKRRGLEAVLFQADMRQFALRDKVDAAYNTFDSFRHLLTEADALAHLRCVGESLRPGGLYILGLHLFPPDASEECIERWSARHAGTKVTCTLRVLKMNLRQRREWLRIVLRVERNGVVKRFFEEFPLRTYSARQMSALLKKVEMFELCDVFDFWYEIDRPMKLRDDLADVVLVLRRR